MAKAVFHDLFNHSDPKNGVSFRVMPSPEPQDYPERVVAAAVAAGKARRVPRRKGGARKTETKSSDSAKG